MRKKLFGNLGDQYFGKQFNVSSGKFHDKKSSSDLSLRNIVCSNNSIFFIGFFLFFKQPLRERQQLQNFIWRQQLVSKFSYSQPDDSLAIQTSQYILTDEARLWKLIEDFFVQKSKCLVIRYNQLRIAESDHYMLKHHHNSLEVSDFPVTNVSRRFHPAFKLNSTFEEVRGEMRTISKQSEYQSRDDGGQLAPKSLGPVADIHAGLFILHLVLEALFPARVTVAGQEQLLVVGLKRDRLGQSEIHIFGGS